MSVSLSNAFDELVEFCTLISSNNDKRENIDLFEEFVRVDPLNPSRMVLRAKIKYTNDEEIAMNDFAKAIELDPENPDWYEERALWYADYSRFENEKMVKDFSRAIALDPQNPRRYWQRGELGYSNWEGHFEEALADYIRAIELDPENPVWYSKRGDFFVNRRDVEGGKGKARSDYLKSVELDPDDSEWQVKLGDFYFDEGEWDSAFSKYTKAIEVEPEKPILYAKRAGVFLKEREFEKAIADCNKGLDIDPEEPNCFLVRGLCYREKGDLKKFEEDFIEAIDSSNKSIHVFYCVIFWFYRNKYYQKVVDLARQYDWKKFHFSDKIVLPVESFLIDLYEDSLEYRLPAAIGSSLFKLDYYEEALPLLEEAFEYELVNVDYEFVKPIEASVEFSKQQVENAKIEERNRIIADLSHSIKNLIATVIDPLQQLKQSETAQPQVIDNAIRGANLIREIVNAMNLSFKGSIDDFRYDARHNDSPDAMSVEQMVLESLKHSAGNMFDGKYFEKFMRKYFPSREIYEKARSAWSEATSQSSLEPIFQTLAYHFFDPEISLENAADFRIGNEKGSAVKLMILFQEMIFNAVKYAAFVPQEERFVRILFQEKDEDLVFRVENSYDPSIRVKSSGLGHVIIRNFAATLGTEPIVHSQENVYSVTVQFPNFWKERKE